MSKWKSISSSLLIVLVVLSLIAPITRPVLAQQAAPPAPAVAAPDLATRLGAIEKAIEEKRQELGIPGAALVIVKDDKVIYLKGLGLKDFENKVAVTPDSLFA